MKHQDKQLCRIHPCNFASKSLCVVLLCATLAACTSAMRDPASGSTDLGSVAPLQTQIPVPAPIVFPPPPPPPPPPRPDPGPQQALSDGVQVTVYYATDRQFQADKNNYGGEANQTAPYLSYGSVQVTLPEKRGIGEYPQAPWWRFFFDIDTKKYVEIKSPLPSTREDFFATVKQQIQAHPGRSAALIYIHGYNNSFDDAAGRTAQMAIDLDIGAIPVFYSWPSRAHFLEYIFDRDSVEWTQDHLQDFMEDFAEHSSADDIYIIAHSMGNRPMTMALTKLLEKRPDLLPRFKQVILAAPDVNAAIFRQQIAPRIAKLKLPVTLYASKNDKAINLAYKFSSWERIGGIHDPVVGIPGLDFIDASAITMNFMGHDYVASNRVLLTDIATMIKTGQGAGKRGGLRGIPKQLPQYWTFP